VEHLDQEQLEALVMGMALLDDDDVRRHLATCEACALRLALEAQLETDLYGAAATVAGVRMAHAPFAIMRMWRVALPLAAGLAVVAFATWSLISREKADGAFHGTPTVGERPMEAPGSAAPPRDVCRCVTVELSQGPPSDPGASDLCTAGANP
jgi:hypothetical protein